MTDQPREPWNSWGQMLPRFFKPGVAVANHAESGESLRSFAAGKRLEKILERDQAGRLPVHPVRPQRPEGARRRASGRSRPTRSRSSITSPRPASRGPSPSLVTPVSRRSFGPDGKIVNNLGDYPEAVRQVAREEDVPLIDLNAMSSPFYEALGPEGSKKAFVDNTHHNNYGSYELARCVVEGIRRARLGLAGAARRRPPALRPRPSRPDRRRSGSRASPQGLEPPPPTGAEHR